MEGGKATKKWRTERATKSDVKKVVELIAQALKKDKEEIAQNLLGTSRLTYQGHRKSSGDIDITLSDKNFSGTHREILKLAAGRGLYNTGTKVASYAIDVGNGKLVQVDLMPAGSLELSKFMHYSTEGVDSKYKGAVRNIILMTLATFILEEGKDFVIKDEEGQIIARASRSLKLDVGLERLFKVAKMRKDGQGRVKNPEKVSPDELEHELDQIEPTRVGKFVKSADIINDPDQIAHFFFGKKVFAKDIMTAEQVIDLIKKKYRGPQLKEIITAIKDQLKQQEFEVPSEL